MVSLLWIPSNQRSDLFSSVATKFWKIILFLVKKNEPTFTVDVYPKDLYDMGPRRFWFSERLLPKPRPKRVIRFPPMVDPGWNCSPVALNLPEPLALHFMCWSNQMHLGCSYWIIVDSPARTWNPIVKFSEINTIDACPTPPGIVQTQ